MPHDRADDELAEDDDDGDRRPPDRPPPALCVPVARQVRRLGPPPAGQEPHQRRQAEDPRREAPGAARQVEVDPDDTQPAEPSLEDYRPEHSDGQPADPPPAVGPPG